MTHTAPRPKRRLRRSLFGVLGPCVAALSMGGSALLAQQLDMPANSERTRETRDAAGTYAVPLAPWRDGQVDGHSVQGEITREAWRISASSLTTLQLMNRLAAQLATQGFDTLFRCENSECGGFDFRFAMPVLPPPEMFVDLFDYRFLAARKGVGGQARYVTLLVSRSGAASYVQVTRVEQDRSEDDPDAPADLAAAPAAPVPDDALIAALRAQGHAVLDDLDFGTGAASLSAGPYASLAALAAFLAGDPQRRIALVGHTDTVGGYEANLALSRRRAEAVMQRLISAHGVAHDRLEAEGIAYLSPVAPNDAASGREANRRVEAVLLSRD